MNMSSYNGRSLQMNLGLAGLLSFRDGRVCVVIKSDLLGLIHCEVKAINPTQAKCEILKIENESLQCFGEEDWEFFVEAITNISSLVAQYCLHAPEDWAVVRQAPHFDIWKLRKKLDLLEIKEARFPLFGNIAR